MVIMPKLFCARKELNYLCGNEEKKKNKQKNWEDERTNKDIGREKLAQALLVAPKKVMDAVTKV